MPESPTLPVLLVLSAPSGAGKTTVGRNLLTEVPGLERAVTCTTRPPRHGERPGHDYHFLDLTEFLKRLESGEFLESAEVYGNRYGTLRSEVLRRLEAGRDVLLTIDVQGAEAIRQSARQDPVLARALVSVFLMPPSTEELERRLRGRDEDPPEVIARRLAMAQSEIEQWPKFDYVVVSGRPEEDLDAMRSLLITERRRSVRRRSLALPTFDACRTGQPVEAR
jgi:guanylate kinase